MKFLVDAQLPPALADWLRTKGQEATAARDIGLRDADDSVIWAYAAKMEFVIVTKDEDFANLAATGDGPLVLWIRIGNAVNRVLLAHMESTWLQILEHFGAGAHLVEGRGKSDARISPRPRFVP